MVHGGAERRAAAGGRGRPRAGLHPRRRGLGQDDDDHAPDREPGRDGRLRAVADPRGHVHRQGGGRDAGAARARSASTGVPRATFHSAALAQLRHFRPDAVGQDPAVEGARRSGRSRTRCPAPYKFRAGRRPRDRDRVGEEPAASRRERYLRRRSDGHEPPIPADLMHRVYRALRGAEARQQGLIDFEDLLERAIQALRRRARGRRVPRALPRVHRRRVPGRQPAPADAARALARRRATTSASSATTTSRSTGSPARRPSTCSRCRSASRTRRWSGSRRTTARRRRCSSSRTGSCRSSAARRRCCARRVRTGPSRRCGRSRRRRPRAPSSSSGSAAAGCPARGDRDPLPHERAARRLRGGAARGRDPVPGRGAARRARRRGGCCARSSDVGAGGGRASGLAARARLAARPAGQARRARASRGRPTSARLVRLAEELGGTRRGLRRRARAPLRRRRRARRGVHLLTYHGAKGLEFEAVFLPRARGEGAAAQAGEDAGRRSPRSGASSTSA